MIRAIRAALDKHEHKRANNDGRALAAVLAVEPLIAEQLAGAVSLTDAEWERVLWWLHRPVPPGPEHALDGQIIRKITTQRGGK